MLAVTFYDWVLVLHLLSAFAVASALVLFSVLVFNSRRMTTLAETSVLFRIAPVGTVLIGAGLGLVILFGAILAFDSDTSKIWNGWIIAGIVLWAAFAEVGRRTGEYYTAIQKLAQSPGEGTEAEVLARLHASRGALLNLASIAIFVLLLLDMIFKPGASMLAAIRTHSIDLALIVHVAGAMVLVGALVTAAAMGIIGWSAESGTLRRLSYKTLLVVGLPAWIVMWVGALWTESKEHLDNLPNDLTWLTIGHIAAEGGGVLLLVALITGGIGVRRSRTGAGTGLIRASSAIASFLVAIYVIAIWAMGGKPS